MAKDGDFVLPGDELGYSEELLAGEGAYEDDGKVYATQTGTLSIDMDERKLSVAPRTSIPPIPKRDDTVIGKILVVKPQVAIVEIVKIAGNERGLGGFVKGSVHISQTSSDYVQSIDREFREGDIIVARVLNPDRDLIQLTTADKDTGVVKAYCSLCNTSMSKDGDRVKCPECGRRESRKFSSEYGSGELR